MNFHFSFASGAAILLGALSLCSCKDDDLKELALTMQSDSNYEISQGEVLSIPYSLENLSQAVTLVTAASDNADYTASVEPSATDPYSGTIKVSAPDNIVEDASFTVSLKAQDQYNTNRVCNKTITVKPVLSTGLVRVNEAANTFIVAPGSLFGFIPFKGNSTDKADCSAIDLLWQDNAGMVKDIFTKGDYVYVSLAEGVSGNAVIVAGTSTAASWSWNLWVTDYDPATGMMSYTASDEKTYQFMDRNLGALTNKAGDENVNGNFYQWGRKDAFPGSTYEGELRTMFNMAADTVLKVVTPCAEADNLPTSVATPLTHYSGVSGGNYSWMTNAFATAPLDAIKDYWGSVSGNKGQNDPCPSGWKVPSETAMGFYVDKTLTFEKVYNSTETTANKDFLGWNIIINNSSFFFPSQGEVQHSGTLASCVGTTWPCGKLWTATADNMSTSSYFRARVINVSPSSHSASGVTFGYELPVRCVKE